VAAVAQADADRRNSRRKSQTKVASPPLDQETEANVTPPAVDDIETPDEVATSSDSREIEATKSGGLPKSSRHLPATQNLGAQKRQGRLPRRDHDTSRQFIGILVAIIATMLLTLFVVVKFNVFESFNTRTPRSPASLGAPRVCTDNGMIVIDGLVSACELPTQSALQGSHDRTVESWLKTSVTGNSNLLTVTPRQNGFPVSVDSGQAMDIALVGANGPGGCKSQIAAGLYVHFQDSDVHVAGPSLADSKWHYVAVTVSGAGTLVRVEIDGQEPAGYVWEPPNCYPDEPQAQPIHLRTPANTRPQSVRVGGPGWADRGFVGDLELAVLSVALDPGELRTRYQQSRGAHI
jgi:hypothetical protein